MKQHLKIARFAKLMSRIFIAIFYCISFNTKLKCISLVTKLSRHEESRIEYVDLLVHITFRTNVCNDKLYHETSSLSLNTNPKKLATVALSNERSTNIVLCTPFKPVEMVLLVAGVQSLKTTFLSVLIIKPQQF